MGEGQVLKNMLPFGAEWPMNAYLHTRAEDRRESFRYGMLATGSTL